MAGADGAVARYRDVFAVGEFRVLFAAHPQSVLGDQLARVAVAVLVFGRPDSPGLAALADRFPGWRSGRRVCCWS